MKIKKHHSWNLDPKEAIRLQKTLAKNVIVEGNVSDIRLIAGVDLGFLSDLEEAVAGIIVYTYPNLEEVERVNFKARVKYPYIPGLLSFREGPVVEGALEKIKNEPDVILFDGQGIAHPRRLGIASHMGLILQKPAIGCAKSRLCGLYDEPGQNVGDWSSLRDERSEEVIGTVVRTRKNVKPIFVSVGHMISLERSLEIVLNCLDRTRIPKPTREADRYVKFLCGQKS